MNSTAAAACDSRNYIHLDSSSYKVFFLSLTSTSDQDSSITQLFFFPFLAELIKNTAGNQAKRANPNIKTYLANYCINGV